MRIIKNNAYAAMIVLVVVVALFIGMYAMLQPFAMLFNIFSDNTNYINYTNKDSCENHSGSWTGTECNQLPVRATLAIGRIRYAWLIAPFIFVLGLIIWFFTVSTKDDPRYFNLRP